ncbi:DUF2017 domain-containing protein [Angustibacter sp. McL0619]|uniref:DUF2017 domain-containing protein n=1 Tax=Angustibacter sp. McL0619 TaxID=3415676 RepID=UPI003CF2B2A1
MSRGFRRSRRGIRARFDDQERALLAHLFVEVHEMLDDGPDGESDPLAMLVGIGTATDLPGDPAVARLLPDAHRDDPQASADFRRYTEAGLRQRKRDGLELARQTLGRDGNLVLDDAEAQAWVVALTDVRLVLASRMGLEVDDDHVRLELLAAAELAHEAAVAQRDAGGGSDDDGEADPSGGEATAGLSMLLAIYDFLTWLQESLVEALLEPLPRD